MTKIESVIQKSERYLSLAKEVASWSKDPSRKIGAVIVNENHQVLSTGYNGFPRGIADTEERLNNRELKYKYVVHAELNAILNSLANRVELQNSILFVAGLPPCSQCALVIVQAGIKYVVYEASNIAGWENSCDLACEIFREAGVELIKAQDIVNLTRLNQRL